MRRSLVSLAVLGLSLAAVPGFASNGSTLNPFQFSTPVIAHGPFLLSEVYPVLPLGFGIPSPGVSGANPDLISNNQCFAGTIQTTNNVSVTPGVFCLATNNGTLSINANAFATCRPGFGSPFVQSFRLIKTIPGSQKVPQCYPPAQYTQFGKGARAWWALKFTEPGTTFTLEVTTRCLNLLNPRIPEIHIDKWVWVVAATPGTLGMVVDMLHSSALSTLEFPCIADEAVYAQLKALTGAISAASTEINPSQRLFDTQNLIFAFESFVLMQCVYGDIAAPDFLRPGLGFYVPPGVPPGNLVSGTHWAPPQFLGSLNPFDQSIQGGILDTIENPCCCKLMADVEFIFNNL